MSKNKNLTDADRQKLIERFGSIKPALIVKKEGVRENIVWGLNSRLAAEQVIKVEFNTQAKTEIQSMSTELAEKTGSTVIGIKSNTALFFREHPNRSLRELLDT